MAQKAQIVKLSLIDADPLQPRKNFDAAKLATLAASLKKHGIMNPLIVEEKTGGRYILVDGERRYRASKQLKMTEVPVVVRAPQSDTHRLIEQFHLQEQHLSWTPIEKAVAVAQLAESMKISILELSQMLGLARTTVADYVAFSNLLERQSFEKNEIPLAYAPKIVNLTSFVKKTWMTHNLEFTEDMVRDLEEGIIIRIKSGGIQKVGDLTKIRDAVATDHKSIKKFIEQDSMSVDKLFLDSHAQTAKLARNLLFSSGYIATYGRGLRAAGGLELIKTPKAKAILERAAEEIKTLLHS